MSGAASAGVTGEFEVLMDGKLLHSKLGGDGFVDSEEKMNALLAKIAARCKEAGYQVSVDADADVSGFTGDAEGMLRIVVLMLVGYLVAKFGFGL